MKSIKFVLFNFLAVATVTGLVLTTSVPAYAAGSNSLGVNPRRDYTVKSGETLKDSLFVSNLSTKDALSIKIDLIDFGSQDETGSPKLLLNKKEPVTWSLKPYLKIDQTVNIAPGKSAEIPFTISIPAKLGAGSYYSAIKYSTVSDGAGENLSLTSSSATLMFVRVPGETKGALALEKFGAFTPDVTGKSGSFGSLYIGAPPKFLAYRVANKGNVAQQPSGGIALKNVFGKKVKIIDNANKDKSIVLIEQTRRIDVCLNPENVSRTEDTTGRNVEETKCNESGLSPGRYTAQLALVYGDNGDSSHELRSMISFWYLPVWFIVVSLLVIAAVGAVIWYAVRSVRRRGKPGFSRRR